MTLDDVAALPDDWDGEDAPAPTADAVASARACLADLAAMGVVAWDIDGDVMGGVAVYLYADPPSPNYVWLAFGNDGTNGVVYGDASDRLPRGERLTPESLAKAVAWVNPADTETR